MWWFRWHARKFFRSFMKPMKPEVATRWHRNSILLYIFFAWNFCGFAFYKVYKSGKLDEAKESPRDRALRQMQILNLERSTVYFFTPFKPMEKFELSKDDLNAEQQ